MEGAGVKAREAAQKGDARALVAALMSDSAARDAKDENGWAPLHRAAESGRKEWKFCCAREPMRTRGAMPEGRHCTPLH
jgi:hypothetical protein